MTTPRFATPDEHVGLAEPDGVEAADLDLWRSELSSFATSDKVAMALELEKLAKAGDKRIRQVPNADYHDSASESAIATSTGIEATGRRTGAHVSTMVVAAEGDSGEVQTGTGYSAGRAPGDLDVERAADDAVMRAVRMLGATKPPSGTVTVVLDKRVAATLLSILSGTLSGEEVAKGRSLFAGRLGEPVAAPTLTLVEDPTDPAAFGAARYDSEGLATRPVTLVEQGRLTAYLYDTYAGRLAGAASTASAVRAGFKGTPTVGARAVSPAPGRLDEAGVLQSVGEGLFVQSVTGIHSGVNTVSGDFSVGASGLMIRDGALAEPVREITVASTIQRMLQHIVAIGSDLEWLPGNSCGLTLAIAGMSMSGA